MHNHCSGLGVLVLSVSVGTACWAQTPEPRLSAGSDLGAYWALIGRESCDLVSPGFRAATNSGYERWRSENAAAIAALEASAEFQAVLAESRARMKSLGAEDRRKMEDSCAQLRDMFEVRPPDPRLATPTKTWELFLASLRAADRAMAIRCLTSTARSKLKDEIERAPDDVLRQMGNSNAKFGLTDTFRGRFREGFAVHHDGQGAFIYFEERNGEWLISEM